MKNLNTLATKYAGGGRVHPRVKQALDTISQATDHINAGEHAKALALLQSDPVAMSHPDVATVAGHMQDVVHAQQHFADGGVAQGQPQQVVPPQMVAATATPLQTGAMSPQVGGATAMDSLVAAMRGNPEAAPVLKAHALALLRANLNAAHAIHTLTGDPSAYGHYQQGSRVLSQALGGNSDSVTAQMIAQEMGQGGQGNQSMAIAPAAIQAANQAVPAAPSPPGPASSPHP